MKAAEISIRPKFDLMKQSDVVSFYHMQMPRWLFVHSKYKTISLEAKVAYTFLLNRFQLSKMNGWVNSDNEVFVIFTRESLADEMGISYKKAIACFKELVTASLIWEQRLGRGNANQIYLASVELSEEDASNENAAPFRPAKTEHQETISNDGDSVFLSNQDLPYSQDKTSDLGTSRTSKTAHQDMPKPHTSNTNFSYIDFSNIDISQSDGLADKNLPQIITNCELGLLPTEVAGTFKNAIERLFYSDSFKVDGIILPQEKVRSDLLKLEGSMIMEAYRKLKKNTDKVVKNSTAYLMAVIYNCIFEVCSDVLVDLDTNSMEVQLGGETRCF